VVRISGARAIDAAARLAGSMPPPRQAALRALHDPRDGRLIDRGLVLAFPGPSSFTGEDVVELQVHGGPAVVAALLEALTALDGVRLAEPGEFSRRAFDNGKLDLTQAEGLADLIDARTEAQRRQALAQTDGRLRDRAEAWRRTIIELLAAVEAELDFSDEGDVGRGFDATNASVLRDDIVRVLDDARIGERLRDGLAIAVVGAPNVGKSSLINRLARRDVAIVSDIAGTTRDLIEVPLDVGGVAATLIDTAGLRDTDDPIEREGVDRARRRAEAADLVLHIVEAASEPPLGQMVVNKIDVGGEAAGQRDGVLYVSARTGDGVAALEHWLVGWAAEAIRREEPPLITRARQRAAVTQAVAYLDEAIAEADIVLRAEALRLAARALGRVTGRVDVEDVLGEIFSRFCIGK
jgi:tRNA modification GTPase